ncbi:MAG: choice-of-anchor D domain-containing protein [Verrucomicrobiales bacterium]|nr:choice-of-anchor D domain-containing protein [Verrucomicrobiales bacterium]
MKTSISLKVLISSLLMITAKVALGAAPTNDHFVNARALTKSFEAVSGTTVEATRQAGERTETGRYSVWYKWTAPSSGRLRISVQPKTGSTMRYFEYDVWRGTALDNLRRLGGDSGLWDVDPREDLPVVKGVVYYLSVGHLDDNAAVSGTFDLSLVLDSSKDIMSDGAAGGSATNDKFTTATDLSGQENRRAGISYGNEALAKEAGEPVRNPKYSSWWKWVAPENGVLGLSLAGSDLGNYYAFASRKTLVVYEATSFSQMATSAPLVYASVTSGLPRDAEVVVKKGRTYYIAAGVGGVRFEGDSFSGGTNPLDFAWRVLSLSFRETSPSLTIYGNGSPIPNNELFPQPANGTDFGSIALSGGALVHTYDLINEGTADLTISVPAVIAGSSAFQVIEQPAAVVSPGAGTTLIVAFDPESVGLHTATLMVTSNDPLKSVYSFAVQGMAEPDPAVVVVSTPPGFAPLAIGKASSRRILVGNYGGSDLVGLWARVSGRAARDFRVTGLAQRILSPGEGTTVTVTFRPRSPGIRRATLTVGGNTSIARVPLSGRAKFSERR